MSSSTHYPTPIPTDPQTPSPTRQARGRSDTILTTSSSDSYPHLQTPPTASILGVLHNGTYKQIAEPLGSPTPNRTNSYGLGGPLSLASSPDIVARISPSSPSIQPYQHASPPIAQESSPVHNLSLGYRQSDNNGQSSIVTADHSEGSTATNATRRSNLKAAVRQKLERSRSSLRSLRGSKDDETDDGSGLSNPPSLINIDGLMPVGPSTASRPKKSRFKSLLTISRNSSSASIRSNIVDPPIASPSIGPSQHIGTNNFHTAIRETLSSAHHIGHHEVTVRDFAHSPHQPMPAAARIRHLSIDATTQLDEGILFTRRSRNPVIPFVPVKNNDPSDLHGVTPRPIRISRPRAASMPLVDTTATALLTEEPEEIVDSEFNYFDALLPRELKVLIMKTLLNMHRAEHGTMRWSGETRGKRELIKLSRVSRSWQHLCLDGQLWSDLQLTPFAHVLHPNTLNRIVESALPFITELSLQGLNTLRGSSLLPSLSPFDRSSPPLNKAEGMHVWMPNLRTIDFRGANRLSAFDICAIIAGSPGLKSINLKAVQNCTSEVIRTIARSGRCLESLDVTRCRNLTIGDLIFLISSMDEYQSSKLRCLRVGGMKSYGRHAAEFLPLVARQLVNLETLDCQECTHIFDGDFERFAQVLRDSQPARQSGLIHINLSGCTALKGSFIKSLIGLVPELKVLELAGFEGMFKELSSNEKDKLELDLIGLIKTTPHIEKIDLDFTGSNGGISDKFLDTLSRYCPGDADTEEPVGQNLKELRLGHAADVTAEGLARLIRGLKNLNVLEIDNTSADNTVLRTFMRYHPLGTISIIDCRSVRTAELEKIASSTRCRNARGGGGGEGKGGMGSWEFSPFQYDQREYGDMCNVKSFQGWRGTTIPQDWRTIRQTLDGQAVVNDKVAQALQSEKDGAKAKRKERKSSWWSASAPSSSNSPADEWNGEFGVGLDHGEEGGRGCIVM
ncbi:uncharacterized protein I303_106855 [Kwoniella dejecticola CBS 10117]|uniref:F-box domain-containing protein n=1 Tax=Kwoniella dejecticola CBS 10117 TaxID=1296121 RepID=A0A1A5ZTH1_9TREE|nr:uncharacterized protein I303_08504 [Kwoniella dejecticola CBS 10117]OBR81121.1 hypothetical protein I303_08504 [Kwoniella dejecticola CBS 10117]